MNYYIADTATGTHKGPYSVEQLRYMTVTPDTLVWNDTMTDWTRAIDVPELRDMLFAANPSASAPRFAPGGHTGQTMIPERPHTWLVEAILATILCFLPFGIVAIVKAVQVSSAYDRGDYAEAVKCSRSAKTWVIWSVLCPIILYAGVIILLAFGGLTTTLFQL